MAERQASRRPAADDGSCSRPRDGEKLRSLPGARVAESTGELDRLVHERVRLGVLSGLAVNRSLSFSELKRLLHVTDGNLSVHARKLEEAGYVDVTKSFEKRQPKTEYRLTPKGRRALQRYLDHMEALIRATREP